MWRSPNFFDQHGLSLNAFIALVERLWAKARPLSTIVIGGTNGKGTSAAMTAALLTFSGKKTGLLTSPHICDVRERFAIDGKLIDSSTLMEVSRQLERQLGEDVNIAALNFFQYVTLIGLSYFRQENVDLAVLEVGLGGRLDPTNYGTPMLSGLTTIDLDHTDRLGSDRLSILKEKLPIARSGATLVFGETRPDLIDYAQNWCRKHSVRLYRRNDDFRFHDLNEKTYFEHANGKFVTGDSTIAEHQKANRSFASAMALHLLPMFTEVFSESVASVLDAVVLPARQQRINNFCIDMAHNDQALEQLAVTVAQPYSLIIAQPANRCWSYGLEAISKKAKRIICPQLSDYFRSADQLCGELRHYNRHTCSSANLDETLKQSENDFTIVCGSSRLAAAALEILTIDTSRNYLYRTPERPQT